MAGSISYLGSLIGIVTGVTLSATSVEALAHSLPTTPDRWGLSDVVSSATDTLVGKIRVQADSSTLTFTNNGDDVVGISKAWFEVVHTTIR